MSLKRNVGFVLMILGLICSLTGMFIPDLWEFSVISWATPMFMFEDGLGGFICACGAYLTLIAGVVILIFLIVEKIKKEDKCTDSGFYHTVKIAKSYAFWFICVYVLYILKLAQAADYVAMESHFTIDLEFKVTAFNVIMIIVSGLTVIGGLLINPKVGDELFYGTWKIDDATSSEQMTIGKDGTVIIKNAGIEKKYTVTIKYDLVQKNPEEKESADSAIQTAYIIQGGLVGNGAEQLDLQMVPQGDDEILDIKSNKKYIRVKY